MSDLSAMRAERDRLDCQIREAEADAVGTFNFNLGQLSDALYAHAQMNGIPWADMERKNWTAIVLADRVTVEFGRWDDYYGQGGLRIRADGVTAEFDPLPSAGTLLGLADFLLAQEGR